MDSQSYLIFSLGNARYGVEALLVQELFFLPQLTPVVDAPPAIAGIVQVRGEILSVINLERFLRCKPQPYSITDSVIILAQGDRRVGIVVHQVHEIQTLSADQIATDWAGRSPTAAPTAALTGVTQLNEQLVFLLNAASLFGYLHTSALPVSSSELDLSSDTEGLSGSDRAHTYFLPEATPEEREIFLHRAKNLLYQTETQDASQLIPLAVIGLGNEYFGIELDIVREFTDVRQVTPIPCCPDHVVGNMNLRGEILTLVDVRPSLSVVTTAQTTSDQAVVLQVDDIIVGLQVDEVCDVVYLHPSDIKPVPNAVRNSTEDYLKGSAPYQTAMMSILDLAKFLSQGGLVVDEEVT